MRYGYFDDRTREYVIQRPDTPLPWMNYLGQEDYFAMISNTGGGYSFYRDARLRRIIRYRSNGVPLSAKLTLYVHGGRQRLGPSLATRPRTLDAYSPATGRRASSVCNFVAEAPTLCLWASRLRWALSHQPPCEAPFSSLLAVDSALGRPGRPDQLQQLQHR
jgi:hypothetical protein